MLNIKLGYCNSFWFFFFFFVDQILWRINSLCGGLLQLVDWSDKIYIVIFLLLKGEKFEVVKTAVKKAMEELSKKEILDSQNTSSPLMLDDEDDDNFDFTEQLRKKVFGAGYINPGGETSTKKVISAEIEGYLNSKPVPANTNVLEFWKQNQYIYPIMSRLARKILCIPAASSTSERVFSTAGNIYSSRTTNLSISKRCFYI